MRIWRAAAILLLAAGAATAAPAHKPAAGLCEPLTARAANTNAIDPMAACQAERSHLNQTAQSLRAQIADLQTRIGQNGGLTFKCLDRNTSQNSQGFSETCAPYTCNFDTGRCRSDAQSSDDCSDGFLMADGRCVSHR